MLRPTLITLTCLTLLAVPLSVQGDEGQWPMNMLSQIDFQAAGLELTATDIFNPNAPALADAICRVGGGTGSFVSDQGLIITNHHVAFDAVRKASTPEANHLENGFFASELGDELQAKGYVCRITERYEDVSAKVLKAVKSSMSLDERNSAIAKRIASLTSDAKALHPGKKIEVAAMFPHKSYTLFVYQEIPDVRIVCAPPRAIGEYGGETDNWIWPRHTGDFAFLRAYVAPDGKPRRYSKENVPFRPRRSLRVSQAGTKPGDPVFLLGYPGRTYRHQPAGFVEFEATVRMPFYASFFRHIIDTMEEMSAKDEATALALASEIKGRANVMKNYQGKVMGIARIGLVATKRAEDAELDRFCNLSSGQAAQLAGVAPAINRLFDEKIAAGAALYIISQLQRSTNLMTIAADLIRRAADRAEPINEGENAPGRARRSRMIRTRNRMLEEPQLGYLLNVMMQMDAQSQPYGFVDWLASLGLPAESDGFAVAQKLLANSLLNDADSVEKHAHMSEKQLGESTDGFLSLLRVLKPAVARLQEMQEKHRPEIAKLMPQYVEARRLWKKGAFVPDANRTLRFTYGRVQGYQPKDAVTLTPHTNLRGVVEKHTGEAPFNAPQALLDAFEKKDFGRYALNGDVPVGLLYDTDTTGGNSGSPVMDKNGNVVGVNFDRCYEATINDYQWHSDYSRSIGVDIRYVLWVTEKLMGADRVIKELGVK